jgi:hypothetical protein
MSDDTWAAALDIPPEQAVAFRSLAEALGSSPEAVLRKMIAHVLEVDRQMGAFGLRSLPKWVTKEEAVQALVDHAVGGLSLDIRPTGFMWPSDKAFPWTAEECRAAVLGYKVKWHGDFDDFWQCLRGKWELSDGYAVLHQF